MHKNRSYYVEPELNENHAGHYCFCFSRNVLMEKRFFRSKDDAESYGENWCASPMLAYG